MAISHLFSTYLNNSNLWSTTWNFTRGRWDVSHGTPNRLFCLVRLLGMNCICLKVFISCWNFVSKHSYRMNKDWFSHTLKPQDTTFLRPSWISCTPKHVKNIVSGSFGSTLNTYSHIQYFWALNHCYNNLYRICELSYFEV